MWLVDAPHSYHQIRVSDCTREKLVFARPNATKWTYDVMPFGPVNGPTVFISFIHDMDSTRKELVLSRNIHTDDDTNTRIIVDDILNWAKIVALALVYYNKPV